MILIRNNNAVYVQMISMPIVNEWSLAPCISKISKFIRGVSWRYHQQMSLSQKQCMRRNATEITKEESYWYTFGMGSERSQKGSKVTDLYPHVWHWSTLFNCPTNKSAKRRRSEYKFVKLKMSHRLCSVWVAGRGKNHINLQYHTYHTCTWYTILEEKFMISQTQNIVRPSVS